MLNEKLTIVFPCYNEELSISATLQDFASTFPGAKLIICDNHSSDETAQRAQEFGAEVVFESRKGKGFAVRKLFQTCTSEYVLMSDGDQTYAAKDARVLFNELINLDLDMVVGNRHAQGAFEKSSSRKFHKTGNRAIAAIISQSFGIKVDDPLSGLRVFHRRFYSVIPLMSQGFEIETELTLNCVDKGFSWKEIPIEYGPRTAGSHSKLKTFSDGFKIMASIIRFILFFRPMLFCSILSVASALICITLGYFPVMEYLKMQYVKKVPSLIVSTGFGLLGLMSFYFGFVLESIRFSRREFYALTRRLHKKE